MEVFTHLGDQGLPSGLLLEIAVTIIVAFTVRQLLTSLAEHAAKQVSQCMRSHHVQMSVPFVAFERLAKDRCDRRCGILCTNS